MYIKIITITKISTKKQMLYIKNYLYKEKNSYDILLLIEKKILIHYILYNDIYLISIYLKIFLN